METSLEQMRQLGGNYTTVSTKTNSLHDACETLLADQVRQPPSFPIQTHSHRIYKP